MTCRRRSARCAGRYKASAFRPVDAIWRRSSSLQSAPAIVAARRSHCVRTRGGSHRSHTRQPLQAAPGRMRLDRAAVRPRRAGAALSVARSGSCAARAARRRFGNVAVDGVQIADRQMNERGCTRDSGHCCPDRRIPGTAASHPRSSTSPTAGPPAPRRAATPASRGATRASRTRRPAARRAPPAASAY